LGDVRQAHEVERFFGLAAALALFFAQAPGVHDDVPQARLRAQPVADDQVVEHRGPVEQMRALERASDAEARDAIGAQLRDVLPLEDDPARSGLVRAGNEIEEGRLAGTVGADDRADLAAAKRRADVADRGQSAESLGEGTDFEHGPAFLTVHRPTGPGSMAPGLPAPASPSPVFVAPTVLLPAGTTAAASRSARRRARRFCHDPTMPSGTKMISSTSSGPKTIIR